MRSSFRSALTPTSLRLAREKRDEARRRLAAGIDPSAERQAAKLAAADTFEAIGREWLEVQKSKLSAATLAKAEWMLTTFVFPHIGSRAIGRLAERSSVMQEWADYLDGLRSRRD